MRWLHENWFATVFLVAILASVGAAHIDTNNRANINSRESIQRSEDTCRRGNPGRAYLQIRSYENPSNDSATVGPKVWAILNCRATVLDGGRPVPLSRDVQDEYIRLFKSDKVPITRGDAIVGSTPMETYFAGKGPLHP